MYDCKVVGGTGMVSADIVDVTLFAQTEKNIRDLSHANRVSELCKSIGVAMKLSEIVLYNLGVSGFFHDIGKIAVSETILNKPGPLTPDEWVEIKRHPEAGYRILCTSLEMTEIAKYVLYHHERYDGLGYPKGLKKNEIPFISRIISVADSYDAMTNQRLYKKTLNQKQAVQELLRNRGKQFDPDIVDIFVEKVLHII